MEFARLDSAWTSAVAADDGRCLELAGRNDFTDAAAHPRGLDADDLALLDVISQKILRAAERCRGNRQILESHVLDEDFHDHARHIVAIAESMMERDRHAVMCAALLAGFADGSHDLAFLRFLVADCHGAGFLERLAVHMIFALVDFFAVLQEFIRNISSYCVDHFCSSL